MKRLVLAASMIILTALGVSAQTFRNNQIRRMRQAVDTAFVRSELGELDKQRLRRGKIKLVIEYSLIVDDEQFEVRHFANFKQMEGWLKSREIEQEAEGVGKYRLPTRVVDTFAGCRRGVCRYEMPNGVLHNQLYLQKISYGFRDGRLFVKTIYLYDGS